MYDSFLLLLSYIANTPLKLLSQEPISSMSTHDNLVLSFNQPIEIHTGGIKILRYLSNNDTLLLSSTIIPSSNGMIDVLKRDQLVFNSSALQLQPNSFYQVNRD